MSTDLIALVRERFGERVIGSHSVAGDDTVLVTREGLVELMTFLRDDERSRFDVLAMVTAVDYSEFPLAARAVTSPCDEGNSAGLTTATLPRYEAVYGLLSMQRQHRLRVKVPLAEDELHVPSMVPVWHAANWGERECWDMLGVVFDGHPELKRILTYEEFEGHPLRKDFDQRNYQPLIDMPHLAEYAADPRDR